MKGVSPLEQLRSQYLSIKTVHLRAVAFVELEREGSVAGWASLEYWGDGERFRLNGRSEPQLGLVGDMEFAYDEEAFYFLFGSPPMLLSLITLLDGNGGCADLGI